LLLSDYKLLPVKSCIEREREKKIKRKKERKNEME
jgi:hypothetical protein